MYPQEFHIDFLLLLLREPTQRNKVLEGILGTTLEQK